MPRTIPLDCPDCGGLVCAVTTFQLEIARCSSANAIAKMWILFGLRLPSPLLIGCCPGTTLLDGYIFPASTARCRPWGLVFVRRR